MVGTFRRCGRCTLNIELLVLSTEAKADLGHIAAVHNVVARRDLLEALVRARVGGLARGA